MIRSTSTLRPELVVMLWFGVVLLTVGAAWSESSSPRCEEITIPMCRNIGYNFTFMPNQFNHESQEEAGLEVHQFWPLVEIQCSPDLKFFLCSMYAPICIEDYESPLPACRSVCDRAKAGCAPLMRQYGFAWPERMSCDRLPEYGDPQRLCMDSKNGSEAPERPSTPPFKPNRPSTTRGTKHPRRNTTKDIEKINPCACDCHSPFVRVDESGALFNRVVTGGIPNCGSPCFGTFFSNEERTFATFWIGLWSILCCVSTFVTVTTFLIDTGRFRYPERPIIFLSLCYLLVSIGYLIRLGVGHAAIACDGPLVRYESTSSLCTVVFLLVYLFGMASSIWWVVLSFTWFLAAGLKWGNEAIASYSAYFHLAAWLVPSVQTIAVLATASVDGDPVAGICYVGNQDVDNLRGFVLAPLFVYLLLGTSFLLAGFVSLFRIRNVIKQQQGSRAKTDKLEKLMIRIGIFSVLYTVPATIVIGCHFYEQHYREVWDRHHACPCLVHMASTPVRPDYSVYMLKYFMCLVVGITSGFWIWSGKTIDSWRRFYARLCGRSLPYTHHHPPPLPCSLPQPPVLQRTPGCGKQLVAVQNINHSAAFHKQLPLSHV